MIRGMRCSLIVLFALLVAPMAAVAQQVTAATLPLKDKDTYQWFFFDSVVVGINYGGMVTKDARVNAYSLTGPKFLWRQQDIRATHKAYEQYTPHLPDYGDKVLYIGNGPFTALDAITGAVRWHKECDEAGFIDLSVVRPLGATKLLIAGSDDCKTKIHGDLQHNLAQDRKLMLVNRATGQVAWMHKAKTKEHSPGKFWSHITGASYTTYYIFDVMSLAPGGAGGYHPSDGDDVDRVLVWGERLEAVNAADGKQLWQTKDEVGTPVGWAGGFVFFAKDDKLNAFPFGGTGTPAWSAPIGASTADVVARSPGDSEDTSPLGPGDLFVATEKDLFRLDLTTGSQKWAIKLGDSIWQLRDGQLVVASDDQVTDYDFATGTPKWQLKGGKKLFLNTSVKAGGTVIGLFVDRGEYNKKDDEFVGPYRFWGVDLANGKVAWSLADFDGTKIVDYALVHDGQLRVMGEKTLKYKNLNLADGQPAAAPPGADAERFITYSKSDKTLRARNWAGDVVWERKGEPTALTFHAGNGIVVWPLKSGTVELIKLADGASLWKADMGGDPFLRVDRSDSNIVIPHGDKVTLVRVIR